MCQWRQVQRVNVDFPLDLLHAIDREARRIGVKSATLVTGSVAVSQFWSCDVD